MLSLNDIEVIESALKNKFDLDLNYNSSDSIDIPAKHLHKYPFDRVDEAVTIHAIWRKLYALIKELKTLRNNQEFATIGIHLKSNHDLTAPTNKLE